MQIFTMVVAVLALMAQYYTYLQMKRAQGMGTAHMWYARGRMFQGIIFGMVLVIWYEVLA